MKVSVLSDAGSLASENVGSSASQITPRVMHVITGAGQGGAEKILSDIVARRPEGSDHFVLSLASGQPFFDFGPKFASLGLMRGEISPLGLWRLRAAIKSFKPDVVHSWLYHSILAASLATPMGIGRVWGIHNTDLPRSGSKPLTRVTARLCGVLSHWVPNRIVYCSEAAASWHCRVMGYPYSRSQVIENGIDFDAFAFDPISRARLRAQWGLGEGELAIGSIGRFSPQKGHVVVAAALRQLSLKKATWVIAGEGCVPENRDLSVLRQGLQSLAVGPRLDMAAILSALDLVVIGSCFGEALPVVGIEAVANGVPVVATRVGDTESLVATSAQLANPFDFVDLSRAISSALKLRRGIPELESLRRRLRARFDIDAAADTYHRLYADFANSKRNHRSEARLRFAKRPRSIPR